MARHSEKIFVGRTAELNKIQQCLENSIQENQPWIINIQGVGGIEKSQLIQAVAENIKNNFDALTTEIPIDLAITSHKTG